MHIFILMYFISLRVVVVETMKLWCDFCDAV